MAFISGHTNGGEKKQEVVSTPQTQSQKIVSSGNDLEKVEIEYLLRMLGEADLKGKEVEMFYNLVIKLQQQYINKK